MPPPPPPPPPPAPPPPAARSLQRTLNELKEYQKQHDHYLRQQEALDKHKLLQEEQILRNIIHETQMAKEAQLGELLPTRAPVPLHQPWDERSLVVDLVVVCVGKERN